MVAHWSKMNPAILGVSMKKILEIRAAEGGEDAKLFTRDLAQAYTKHFGRVG